MSKFSAYLFTLLTLVLGVASCKHDNDAPFSLSESAVEIKVGDMHTLEVSGDASNLVWESSDEEVADVFAGVITANGLGMATITAKRGDFSASCIVYVSGTNGATLRVSPLLLNLQIGETAQLKAYNTYAVDQEWSSSDETIASVDQNGLVTAHNSGNAYITLSTALESVKALVVIEHQWGEYKLVWSDEFNGTSLDQSVWGFNLGGGGWGNRELQYYTDRRENVRVEDGFLKIEARKEEYNGNHYTSGRILSKGKKFWTYGKFEARIKFPGGGGTWPAFWMMGNSGGWPACGEIDIQEHVGNVTKRASSALHTPKKNGSKGNNWSATKYFDFDLAADFHVYGCEWAQEEKNGKDVIRFYLDDVQYGEVWEDDIDNPEAWPFNKPHFFIFNLAIGGNMGGNVDDNIFKQERIMYVDWVRVYQREEK